MKKKVIYLIALILLALSQVSCTNSEILATGLITTGVLVAANDSGPRHSPPPRRRPAPPRRYR